MLIKAAVRVMVLVLGATCISCTRQQEGAAGGGVAPPPASDSVPSSVQLAGLLPEDAGVPGWSRSRPPRFFGPDNLWEYIDGAAESRLAFGFEQLATAEYRNSAKAFEVVLDIYRMKDAAGASRIYAAERNPEGKIQAIGSEGCLSGSMLSFWSGSHYVKLTAGTDSAELQPDMLEIARQLLDRLNRATTKDTKATK